MVSCHMTESLGTPIEVEVNPQGTRECIRMYCWVRYSIYNAFIPKVKLILVAVKRYYSRHYPPTYSQAGIS